MARFCVCERGFAAMFQVARGVLSVRQGSIDNTGIHRIVSDNRMRERISMKSKMLGALALLTLIGALFVMQSAEQHTPTVDAATAGSIEALNVGTCLTTDLNAFFADASGNLVDDECDALDDTVKGRDIRDKHAEVTTLYATYAHDPKTQSDDPRAILEDSDLIRISISDAKRDKRTGVLIRGQSNDAVISADGTAGTLGKVIRDDLEKAKLGFQTHDPDTNDDTTDNDVIRFTSDEHTGQTTGEDGIEVYRAGTSTSTILDSGNWTLNFTRTGGPGDSNGTGGATNPPWQFAPGDFKVKQGAEVRIYGCVDNEGTGVGECQPNGPDNTANTLADNEPVMNLSDYFVVDEDASNGEASGDTAPWLAVNASVPTGKNVLILAIYYRTSDRENLVGGEKYYYCGADEVDNGHDVYQDDNKVWRCDDPDTPNTKENVEAKMRGVERVDYAKEEKADNDALVVRVETGNSAKDRKNLWLKETDIFSGRYEGYVRLTDPNGDGDDDPNTADTKETRSDWGLQTKDATGATDSDADVAVLAVNRGHISVVYSDFEGNTQRLDIQIDTRPPAVTIASPADGSSSGDRSPDFSGTLTDGDSGLVDKSFRLVVDNEVDKVDGEYGMNDDYALDEPDSGNVSGPSGGGKVSYRDEYMGYSDDKPTFGEVKASELYNLGEDDCADNKVRCYLDESDEYDDGANRGTFDESLRLDLQEGGKDADTRGKEFAVDFQAFVMDMAGNIGFSDADSAKPNFIDALGEDKKEDRGPDGKEGKKHNILGYYSAHIITLDDKDPTIEGTETATGYYGRTSDGKNIADRYGVMVVFDGPVASNSVSTSTFTVELDDKSMASIVDVDVDKQYVFLKLASELASDATPMIDIADGQKVEDMAGNETYGKEVKAFEANDGISPKLTVTLSGGSGTGTGDEGPEKLTRDRITIHVSTDETLSSNPKIVVACSNLHWNEGGTKDADTNGRVPEDKVGSKHDIDDFVKNRIGAFDDEPGETPVTTKRGTQNTKAKAEDSYKYTCGYGSAVDMLDDDFTPVDVIARPGSDNKSWQYPWQPPSGTTRKLEDGLLTVVAFAPDNSSYTKDGSSVSNWGAVSTEFRLDTELIDPTQDLTGGSDLQPAPDGKSKEARPFVLIQFSENRTVTLDSVELDNVEIADQFERPDHNRFVYWPASISQGDHEVEVEAKDAAGNEVSFSYEFEVVARGDFLIKLLAGWNAVSVPADPVDTTIGSVFTDPAVTTVIGWDTQGWRIAVRRDGVWDSNDKIGEPLNEIRAKYGYWVKSDGFINQPVALTANDRGVGGLRTPLSIDTKAGWNFVGVIDQDGDQTEDHFGISLLDSDGMAVKAGEYLGTKYVRAYTWDATFSNFEVLRSEVAMTIGDGVWVYYEGGIAP